MKLSFSGFLVGLLALVTAWHLTACTSMADNYIGQRLGYDDFKSFGGGYIYTGGLYASCYVYSQTDDFEDVIVHTLLCGPADRSPGVAVRYEVAGVKVACTPEDKRWDGSAWRTLGTSYAVGLEAALPGQEGGTYEVTFRFDDEPVYRGYWEFSENYAFSSDVVDQVLDGLATADRFVFQTGSAERVAIDLTSDTGGDGRGAVAEFLKRCPERTQRT